jgi:hypothetical protein
LEVQRKGTRFCQSDDEERDLSAPSLTRIGWEYDSNDLKSTGKV